MVKKLRFPLFLLLMVGMVLSACSQSEASLVPSATDALEGTLRPYPSDTSTPINTPTEQITPTPLPTATLTPTPVIYEVQENDDMYSIGFYYNISPAAIMTANPSVIPWAMGPGTKLLIPVTPMPELTPTASVEASPTPTPSSLHVKDPDCYQDAVGGLWCFVLVQNREDEPLENMRGWVTLAGDGETRQEIANMSLNLLPAGKSLPLTAYFQPPIPSNFSTTAEVDFFLPVMPGDDRYLAVEITSQTVSMDANDLIANIEGQLSLSGDQTAADYVWVLATAFNEAGQVVGVRRWESDGSVDAGEQITFGLQVYSMAGAIDHVDLLVEAHRAPTSTDVP